MHITALPSTEQTEAILDEGRRPDSDMVPIDLAGWEAVRLRAHLTPYMVETGETEMNLSDLCIRRGVGD
ncbi:MAG TPA: hypothetical protein VF693_09600 [Allosphingosinicella sp.]